MKVYTVVGLVCIAALISAGCEKNYSGSIVGDWHLVKDSGWMENVPPFFNAGSGGLRLIGLEDYYRFEDDGTVYIMQQSTADTAQYTMGRDHNLSFVYNSWHNAEADSLVRAGASDPRRKSFHIETLTSHRLILTVNATANVLTPEGFILDQYTFTK